MRKKLITIFIALLTVLSISTVTSKSANASSYGKIGHVVSPANMRGKWRYVGSSMLGQKTYKHYKVRIGKNHVNGTVLYQADPSVTNKYAENYKKYHFIIDQTMNWGNATIFNRNGIQWLNVKGWTAGAGNGTYYGLVNRIHHGRPTTALAIAIGYKPTIVAYAYRVSKPIHHYHEITETDLHNQF